MEALKNKEVLEELKEEVKEKNKRIYLASPHMGELEEVFVKEAFDTNWIAPLGPNVNNFEKVVNSLRASLNNVSIFIIVSASSYHRVAKWLSFTSSCNKPPSLITLEL